MADFEEKTKNTWYDSNYNQRKDFLWLLLLTSKELWREIEYFKLNSLFLNITIQMIDTFKLSHNIFTELMDCLLNNLCYSFHKNTYSDYKDSIIFYHNHMNFTKAFENIHQTTFDSFYFDIKKKMVFY
jgi:hypothetical protein